MKRVLLWKGLAVLGLALLLLAPLAMVQSQIEARKERKTQVEDNIAQSAAGRQQLTGPLLVFSYTEPVSTWVRDEKTGELLKDPKTGQILSRTEDVWRTAIIAPKLLTLEGQASVEERHRGLYKAQLFHLEGHMKGRFEVPAGLGLPAGRITPQRARVVMEVTDLRGVQNRPKVLWAGKEHEFEAGFTCEQLRRGLVADLGPLNQFQPGSYSFEIPELKLMGTQELSIAPVAEDNQVSLKSDWPDPSFGGRFLPLKHRIDQKGFEAQWQVSSLSRDLNAILAERPGGRSAEAFYIEFVEPVNIYLQSERAVKYGFLFVGLVFAAFFLFEMLKRLPIHPMQYLLVGLSLALFFLLLISLSEHTPFLAAYGVAAASSIVLLWVYLGSVLKSWGRASGFAGGLTLLYGVLYGLLASEDNALLMGSLLLFAALAATMMATRKLDWYGVSRKPEESGTLPG
jgi:inner membrane protein